MSAHVNYSGLIVAGIGFFLTRFTVTLAIYEDPMSFYLAGIVPLALGLGLAAFGVALAVANVEASLVRTTAVWCIIGAGAMLILVVLTLLGSTAGVPDFATIRSRAYLSNFLIGGSVGGTLTGVYAARNRRHRSELQRQTNRLTILNRLLKHEILNAISIIHGYATTTNFGDSEVKQAIQTRSMQIEQTMEEVNYLTRRTEQGKTGGTPIDLGKCLENSFERISEQYPTATISSPSMPENVRVRANESLAYVFLHLLENAILHGGDSSPSVEISVHDETVQISIMDNGPGLPEDQRVLLESGDIEEFDNPGSGFGLNIVRLFVESYGGKIETDVRDTGTRITVILSRVSPDEMGLHPSQTDLTSVRPAIPHLVVTLVAAIIAGVVYGVASELLGGSVAGIGVFYGTADPVVGWLTHEFHSVVFGFVFVSLISIVPVNYRDNISTYVVVGAGWGLFLWVVAASFIAPIWLQLLGRPAPIPSFVPMLLVSHLVWGVSLGILTAAGYRYFTSEKRRLFKQLNPIR